MKHIAIVTISNDNYAVHLATMLFSLFENKSPDTGYRIYIIDGNISPANKLKINRLLGTYGTSPVYLNVDRKLYQHCRAWGHVSREAFYRISIPDLLDRSIKKAIYLDSDMIVKGDLGELWAEEQLDDYCLGAVEDPVDFAGINLPGGYKYFNSGVLLMNLVEWRKKKISEKVLEFIENNPAKIMWWDQDALNAVLYDKWFPLDYKWNYQVFRMAHLNIDPVIIHFNTDVKPWNGKPFLKEEYDYYRNRLNWRAGGERPHKKPGRPMLVSVVMAAHNEAGYIGEAVDSILSQTYRNLELIVVDDASTDATREILKQFDDKRVKVVCFKNKRGAAAALNYGIEQAAGEWIAIHDAGGISFPGRIKEQVGYIEENPGLVAVGSFVECFTEERDPVLQEELRLQERRKNSVQTSEEIRSALYGGCPVIHGTVVLSREAFISAGRYDPRLHTAYGYDLWTRLVTVGPVENVPKKLYKYRRCLTSGNLGETGMELFYSFSKYIRSTRFKNMDKTPVLAVCGGKEEALSFSRQAEDILDIIPVYSINREYLRLVGYYYRMGRLNGAVILGNLPYKNFAFKMLAESGMVLNKNLFIFSCLH